MLVYIETINNANGPKDDRIRKEIIALFKEEGLSTAIKSNLTETNAFNFATEKYFPFQKVNNTPLYINALSKHLPKIIKQNDQQENFRFIL